MSRFPMLILLTLAAPLAGAGEPGKHGSGSPAPGDPASPAGAGFAAASWPTFLGNFQNTSSVEDPKFKPPFRLKWATRLEGQMKSRPVVGGGRVYAQTVNGLIAAFDRETGRVLWRNYHPGVLPGSHTQNRTSPLYADGRLYYAYYPGGLYCVDAATGKAIWKDPDGIRLSGQFSALYHEGSVFYPYWVVSQDKKKRFVIFKALDAATGKEVWRKEFPEFENANSVHAPPTAVSPGCIGDGVLYVSLGVNKGVREGGKGAMLALDPKTGKEIWKSEKYAGGGGYPYVAYLNGRVYVAGMGTPYRCLDAKTGELVWEIDIGGKGTFGSAVSSKYVVLRTYGSPAMVYDQATGKPVTGKDGKPVSFGRGGSTGCSPLVIVNDEWGIQHSGGETRRLTVGRLDRSENVWDWQLAGRACPGSVVAGGCIFTPSGGDGLLHCFEPDDGKAPAAPSLAAGSGTAPPMPKVGTDDWPQFKFDGARSGNAPAQTLKTPLALKTTVKLDAPCHSSPAVMGGKVFVVDAEGTAYGIDPAAQKVLWKCPTGGVNNRSSPIAVGGRVYFGSTDRNFYVLDAADGKVVKKLAMPNMVLASPALTDEGRIYVESFDGTLAALDLDANVLWTLKLVPTAWWLPSQTIAPAPHDVAARGKYVLAVAGNSLFKVRDEGRSGKVVWAHNSTWACGASFLGETFFVGNAPAEQENQALQYLLDDSLTKRSSGPNGDSKTEHTKAYWGIGRVNTPPSASATRACFGSVRAGFWCVDLAGKAEGKQSPALILWSTGGPGPNLQTFGVTGFVGGAALTREHCAFGGLDGKLYVIGLDAKGSSIEKIQPAPFVFEAPDKSMILSTPAVSGGAIYFTTEGGHLYGLAGK